MLPCVAHAESNPHPGTIKPIVPGTFVVVAAPNPSAATQVMGIVPSDATISPVRAAALARFAKTVLRPSGKKSVHIFVFADRATAQAFGRYQRRRDSAPLTPRDYAALGKLWPRTLAFYEFARGRERVYYPSRAPQKWWKPPSAKLKR